MKLSIRPSQREIPLPKIIPMTNLSAYHFGGIGLRHVYNLSNDNAVSERLKLGGELLAQFFNNHIGMTIEGLKFNH